MVSKKDIKLLLASKRNVKDVNDEKKCLKCETKNPLMAQFCMECGTAFKIIDNKKSKNREKKKKLNDSKSNYAKINKEKRRREKEFKKFSKKIDFYEERFALYIPYIHDIDPFQLAVNRNYGNRETKKNLELRDRQINLIKTYFYNVLKYRKELKNKERCNQIFNLNLINYIDSYTEKNIEMLGIIFYTVNNDPNRHVNLKALLLNDLSSLKKLLKLNGVDIDYTNLLILIYERIEIVGYDYLKKEMSDFYSITLEDYVENFVKIFDVIYDNDYTFGLKSFQYYEFFLFNKKLLIKLLEEKGIECSMKMLNNELNQLMNEAEIIELENSISR